MYICKTGHILFVIPNCTYISKVIIKTIIFNTYIHKKVECFLDQKVLNQEHKREQISRHVLCSYIPSMYVLIRKFSKN